MRFLLFLASGIVLVLLTTIIAIVTANWLLLLFTVGIVVAFVILVISGNYDNES